MSKEPWVFMHYSGKDPCNGPVCLIDRKPVSGAVINTLDFLLLDGTPNTASMKYFRCGTCGARVRAYRTEDIRENENY